MWIRGTQNKKLHPPSCEDKAHGRGQHHSEEYWVQRIHAAIGDGLLQLEFYSVHARGLFKPQIAATLIVTGKGRSVAEGHQKWSVINTPEEASPSCLPQKHRQSRGSNLMPVIEDLLSSPSNWYKITETSQYQYPGVFQDIDTTGIPPRLGHIEDLTKLPHFTGDNYHLLYNENHLSKGHYNDKARSVMINGEKQNIHIRYAACQGVHRCSEKGCSFTGSKKAKKCPKHPLVPLESSSACPVYIVYVYPTNYETMNDG